MKDEHKTREQLINELAELRQRIAELEASEIEQGWVEEALRTSARQWQITFDAISDAVCLVDLEGRILQCNTAMTNLLGKPFSEIMGHICWELMYDTSEPIEGCSFVHMREIRRRETLVLPIGDRWFNVAVDPLLDEGGNLIGAVHIMADITERKQAEEALRVSVRQRQTTFDALSDPVCLLDLEGTILQCNEAMTKLLGKPPDEIIGVTCWELVHGTSEPIAGCPIVRMRKTRRRETLVLPVGDRWVNVSVDPVLGEDSSLIGAVHVITDITERKRAEEALKAVQGYTRNIIDSSLDTIIAVDMDRHIVEFNKAAQETFGYRPEEVLGVHVDILYADPREGLTVHQTTIEKGQCVREILSRRKNGEVFPGFLSASVLRDARGELVGVMGVSRDITKRKWAEEALRRRNRELTLLNRAGQAFSSTLDLDQVLVIVLEEVRHLLDIVACSVWLTDPETEELVCRQAVGPQSEIVRGWRLAPGEGLAGWVARSGESLIVPDTRADERHFKEVDRQTGLALRSILTAPLRVRQDVIGVLQAVDTEVGRFSPTDLTLLEPLAASAASAIENARLFEREREQRELSEALEEAAAAVSSTLDLDRVLDRILEQVERVVAGDAFSMVLIEEDAARLARWRGYELPEEKMQPSRFEISITKYPNLMKMARTGEPVVVPDTLADPDWVPAARDRGWRRSYVGAPIQVEGVVVGFLNVSGTRPGQFGPEDARWLETFASHAAIAIGNALLYEQALEDSETKAMLLREVNHRVKNNLAAIIGLLYAERRRAGMEDQAVYQSTIQNLANRVQSLTRVHSLLSASEWAPLPLSQLTTQVISSSLHMLPPGKRISVDVTPSPVRVTSDQAHNLALVINELTINTVKHALQERNTAQITVRIALDDDTVLFEYRDDGPGYPEEVLQLERHNVGFDLIQKMVGGSLRGELSLHNDHGAVVIIRFQAKA